MPYWLDHFESGKANMQQSGVTIDNVVTILHGNLFKTNGRTIAKLLLTWPETLSKPNTKFLK